MDELQTLFLAEFESRSQPLVWPNDDSIDMIAAETQETL